MQLSSGVAVAVPQGSSYSSNLTPSLGTSICHRHSHKKKKVFLLGRMLHEKCHPIKGTKKKKKRRGGESTKTLEVDSGTFAKTNVSLCLVPSLA